jgi:CRP/FNR family cyclic AMP-dependent transcriptional regulator
MKVVLVDGPLTDRCADNIDADAWAFCLTGDSPGVGFESTGGCRSGDTVDGKAVIPRRLRDGRQFMASALMGGSMTPLVQALGTELAIESLRHCSLFAHVDTPTLETVAGTLRRRRFKRNGVIFHQGDPGDSLFIIESGRVKVVVLSSEGAEDAIIATLGPGMFFGELALLDGAARSASAIAVEPSETLVLDRAAFDRLMDTQPRFRRAILAAVAIELRRLTAHVEELQFLDLLGRLTMRIVRMAEETAPDTRRDVRLSWPFNQSELAGMIGGARQSINRLLQGLMEEGLIRFDGDVLVIPDLDALMGTASR